MDAYVFQAALYCEDCAPDDADGPYSEGGGEADCPQHCDSCHVFLKNPLTEDGTVYVQEAVAEHKANDRGSIAVIQEWMEYYDWIGFETVDS